MNGLHFSENLIRLRHKKKLTQEQLADVMGVTKASVSKWENGQSLPDILLLPQMASFFDVSIDALIGYEPQLSREQIKNLYLSFAEAFAKRPFEEVMEESQELVKEYYSCYPFLFQICVLWLNHFMLAKKQERQREILEGIVRLCERILSGCKDIGICNDALIVQAMAYLQLGRAGESAELLEEFADPRRLTRQSDAVLIQAYQNNGEREKADSFAQISMYLNLISLFEGSVQYLSLHTGEPDICEETIRRIDCLIETYHLQKIGAQTAVFYYQAALFFCQSGKTQEAIRRLEQYADCIEYFLKDPTLHADAYFDRIDFWIDQLDLGNAAPRDRKVILESACQVLEHPMFAVLKEEKAYQKIKKTLSEKGEQL